MSAEKTHTAGRPRDAEKTRAAILDAALQEFVASGFSGALTTAIARRANVPQGLLYHYLEQTTSSDSCP